MKKLAAILTIMVLAVAAIFAEKTSTPANASVTIKLDLEEYCQTKWSTGKTTISDEESKVEAFEKITAADQIELGKNADGTAYTSTAYANVLTRETVQVTISTQDVNFPETMPLTVKAFDSEMTADGSSTLSTKLEANNGYAFSAYEVNFSCSMDDYNRTDSGDYSAVVVLTATAI